MTAEPATILELSEDLTRAQRRAEKANREAAQAAKRLQDAMRRFAENHPLVKVARDD